MVVPGRLVCVLAVAAPLALCLACSAPGRPALTKGDLKVDGLRITLLPTGESVTIEPLPMLHHECEGALNLGEPGCRGPFLLPKTAWIYRGLRPGSLVVTLGDDASVRLAPGRDYLVDEAWGSVNAAPGSQFPPGTRLHFAYDYTSSRLDLVERTREGRLQVVKGTEDMRQPLLPETTSDSTPLFSVYLPHNTTALGPDSINLIDPAYRGIPPVSRTEALAPIVARLAEDAPVTIVFFGDSVTAQGPEAFRDGRGSYVDRFATYLGERYPARAVRATPMHTPVAPRPGQVVVVRAGVGGDDTRDALARLDRDVLRHRPDLVVVMFGTNDENRSDAGNHVPVAEYRANLAAIAARLRAAGSEPLLMTTGMKNPGWIGTAGNLQEYAAAARSVAEEYGLCLVDNFHAWEQLPRRGYHPMIFLGSCINHPVDLGHQLFHEGLCAAFDSAAGIACER